MEVHLRKHEVSRKYQSLGRVPATLRNAEARRPILHTAHRSDGGNQPVQIEAAIMDTCVVRITQQVIHPVSIHLTGYEIAPEDSLLCPCSAFDQGRHIIRSETVVSLIEFVLLYSRPQWPGVVSILDKFPGICYNRLWTYCLLGGGDMGRMVIEVPEELTELGKAMAEQLAEVQRTMARQGGGKAVDYALVEQAVGEAAGRTEREAHRAILQSLDIDVPAVVIGKERYTRVGRCEDKYHTMAGSVSVERSLYRKSGERGGQPGGKVVDAVSLRAGVAGDGWLPHTARVMAHAMQQGTSREAEASAREFGRLPYSRSSFEKVAHLVAALAVADHQDIEDALIDAYEVPAEACSVSVSLDRVSVPMEEPRPRPVGRPRKGAAKRPVARNFRMAYVGTVTLHDEQGTGGHTIRYGCMPEGDVIGLRDRMVADVAVLRSKRPDLKLQLLCDGAPEMWNLLDEGFRPKFGDDLHRLVDLYHLTEKLAAAAHTIDTDSKVAGERLSRWKMVLLNRGSAATDILQELVRSGFDEGVGENHPVHAAISYLQTHSVDADRMNYARARRLGLPLGSGNAEATCKSLFEVRMKRCGARWKGATGEHIVQLRALALSDRWGPAVELTLRPLRQAVRAA